MTAHHAIQTDHETEQRWVLHNALEQGLEQLSSCPWLNPALVANQRQRVTGLLDVAMASLASLDRLTTPGNGQTWGWHPLWDDEALRVGLLIVMPGAPIPLHDHPGSTGLLQVLEGRVIIRQYTLRDLANSRGEPELVVLNVEGRRKYATNDYLIFGPEQGNIHAVSAVDGPCVLLDVLFHPYRDEERSWFMPLDADLNEPGCVLAMRMKDDNRSGKNS